jgi:hypothetical protein
VFGQNRFITGRRAGRAGALASGPPAFGALSDVYALAHGTQTSCSTPELIKGGSSIPMSRYGRGE